MGLQSKISPNLISMDLTANAMLAQAPRTKQKERIALQCRLETLQTAQTVSPKLHQERISGTGIQLFTGYQP